MKYLLIAALLPAVTFGQTSSMDTIVYPQRDGQVVFEFIDSSITLSPPQIHNKAKEWVVQTFRNANSVIQLDDATAGKLIIKGNAVVPSNEIFAPIERMEFTIEVTSRENKYRVRFLDMNGYPQNLPSFKVTVDQLYNRYSKNTYSGYTTKKQLKYLEEVKKKDYQALNNIRKYINSLYSSLSKGISTVDNF